MISSLPALGGESESPLGIALLNFDNGRPFEKVFCNHLGIFCCFRLEIRSRVEHSHFWNTRMCVLKWNTMIRNRKHFMWNKYLIFENIADHLLQGRMDGRRRICNVINKLFCNWPSLCSTTTRKFLYWNFCKYIQLSL